MSDDLVINPIVSKFIAENHTFPILFVKVERKRIHNAIIKRVVYFIIRCSHKDNEHKWYTCVGQPCKQPPWRTNVIQECKQIKQIKQRITYETEYIYNERMEVNSEFETIEYKYPNNKTVYPGNQRYRHSYHKYYCEFNIRHLVRTWNDEYHPWDGSNRSNLNEIKMCIDVPEFIDMNDYPYVSQDEHYIGWNKQPGLTVCNECTDLTYLPLFVPVNYIQPQSRSLDDWSNYKYHKSVPVLDINYHQLWNSMQLSVSDSVSYDFVNEPTTNTLTICDAIDIPNSPTVRKRSIKTQITPSEPTVMDSLQNIYRTLITT